MGRDLDMFIEGVTQTQVQKISRITHLFVRDAFGVVPSIIISAVGDIIFASRTAPVNDYRTVDIELFRDIMADVEFGDMVVPSRQISAPT